MQPARRPTSRHGESRRAVGRWAMPRASAVDRVQEVYATSDRRLVGQLTGVTGDPVEAEDAVMEAFARAVNASRSFLAADNPEAWLRTVAVNVTRTRWRRSRFFRDVSPQLVGAASYDDLPEERLALLAALRQLPADPPDTRDRRPRAAARLRRGAGSCGSQPTTTPYDDRVGARRGLRGRGSGVRRRRPARLRQHVTRTRPAGTQRDLRRNARGGSAPARGRAGGARRGRGPPLGRRRLGGRRRGAVAGVPR